VFFNADATSLSYRANGIVSSQPLGDQLQDVLATWGKDALKGYMVNIVSGTGAGQIRRIRGNSGDATTIPYVFAVPLPSPSLRSARSLLTDRGPRP